MRELYETMARGRNGDADPAETLKALEVALERLDEIRDIARDPWTDDSALARGVTDR